MLLNNNNVTLLSSPVCARKISRLSFFRFAEGGDTS